MLGKPINSWGFRLSNFADTTRPTATPGTSVTPGLNTKGSSAQMLSAIARDCYGIKINLNSGDFSGEARNQLVDIMIDPAGGTNYSVLIPDLFGSGPSAGAVSANWFYFPIFIPAGASVAARAAVNAATARSLRVWVTLVGDPSRPDAIDVGTFVRAFGVTAATSEGTAVTPGTTSDGSYVSLGTTAERLWWWQMSMGFNDATAEALNYMSDLAIGDATNKRMVLANQPFGTGTGETVRSILMMEGAYDAAAGSGVYVRSQVDNTGLTNSNASIIVHGLGG
jgi:hypothetical protein